MIGRPRHGDMLVRSASADTMRKAPAAAARSRVRLSSQSGQSPTAGVDQDVRREPRRELRRVVDHAQAVRARVPRPGGGDGQLPNGDSPAATANTSTFTSNTTGTGTGHGRVNAPAPRPCTPGGSGPAAIDSPGQPPPRARRCVPGAPATAPPGPGTPSLSASPAGTPIGYRPRNAPPGAPAALCPHPRPRAPPPAGAGAAAGR
jgi:hypothetical protein